MLQERLDARGQPGYNGHKHAAEGRYRRFGYDETRVLYAPRQEREYRPLWAVAQYPPRLQGRFRLRSDGCLARGVNEDVGGLPIAE